MAIGSTSDRQLLGAVSKHRTARQSDVLGPSSDVTQTLSPILVSTIRTNMSREDRPIAAVECIGETSRTSGSPRFRAAAPATELVEPRERGVEVCLVEELAAVDQVAFDRQNVDLPPLGVEALLRGPIRRLGDDRSEVAQPMHSLDVDADVRRDVPRGTDGCDQVTGRER